MPGMHRGRFAWIMILLVVLGLTAAQPVSAASFDGGEEVELEAGDTIDGNWYVGGNVIRVAGTVDGDLICGGTAIEVLQSGRVTGDLMCAAQSIVVDGRVDGDIRMAGFTLRIGPGGSVGGELMGAGFSAELLEGAEIEGDAYVAGAQGLIDGSIGGDLGFAGAGLEINGQVAGDVEAEVGGPEDGDLEQGTMWMQFMRGQTPQPVLPERYAQPGLSLGPEARIAGDLSYRAPAESELAEAAPAAVGGQTEFEPVSTSSAPSAAPRPQRSPFATWLLSFLERFVALAVIGLILAWLTPRLLGAAQAEMEINALPSAGWGCLTLIVAGVGVLALVLGTIFGLIFLGAVGVGDLVGPMLSASGLTLVLLTAGISLLGWVGRVAVGDLVGRRLLARGGSAPNRYLGLLLGLAIFALLATLPIVGGIFDFLGMLVGLGAVMVYLWGLVRELRGGYEAAPGLT